MSKMCVYSYRLTTDSGFAPCVHGKLLTLSCCKGEAMSVSGVPSNGRSLRKIVANLLMEHKEDTDVYLLGIFNNKLLFYARITDAIKMDSYYGGNTCKRRFDNIYTCDEKGYHGLRRNDNYPHVHPKTDEKRIMLDIAGEWVLMSDTFTYWGKKAPEIRADILDVLPKHQEHKPNKADANTYPGFGHEGMHEYAMSLTDGRFLYKLSEPHEVFENLKGKGCHQK